MAQTYFDDLRNVLIPDNESEWWARTAKSAKHILTAVCFRETAQSTAQKTGSVIFSPIGFYYSLFHLGIALLYMDYATERQELRRLRHNKLQALIQGRLVNTGLLSGEYLVLLRELQELREYANYVFGERVTKYEYKDMLPDLYKKTGDKFNFALKFILQVENEVCDTLGFSLPIQTAIGDGFGDDLIRAYLSKDDELRVQKYLLDNNLST